MANYTDTEMIDAIMVDHLELKSDDPYVADVWVPRLQRMLNDIGNDLIKAADFDWAYVRSPAITIPANPDKIDMSTLGLDREFTRFGEQGYIALATADGGPSKIYYVPPARFFGYYNQVVATGERGDFAEISTVFGRNPATRSPYLYLYPIVSRTRTYFLHYIGRLPAADYEGTDPGDFLLDYIPEEFHDTIRHGIEDLCSAGADDGRDVRGLSARYTNAIKAAVSSYQQEHPFLYYGDDGIPDERMW